MDKSLLLREVILIQETADNLIKEFRITDPIMICNFHIAVCRAYNVCLNREEILNEVTHELQMR